MGSRLDLDVTFAAHRPWVPRRMQLEHWVQAALTAARTTGRHSAARADVSVRIVGAAQSRALNARYRRKDRATNVLSFAGAGALPDGSCALGELVICAPVVAREAVEQGKSLPAHWAHMTVHGVLHLLGFDHERAAAARKMEGHEIQILDRLGFSNPYV